MGLTSDNELPKERNRVKLPTLGSLEPDAIKQFLELRMTYWNSRQDQDEKALKKLKGDLRLTNLVNQSLLKQLKVSELMEYTGHIDDEDRETYNYEEALERYLKNQVKELHKTVNPLKNTREWAAGIKEVSFEFSLSNWTTKLVELKLKLTNLTEQHRCTHHAVVHEQGREDLANAFLKAIEPRDLRDFVEGNVTLTDEHEWAREIKEYIRDIYLQIPQRQEKCDDFTANEKSELTLKMKKFGSELKKLKKLAGKKNAKEEIIEKYEMIMNSAGGRSYQVWMAERHELWAKIHKKDRGEQVGSYNYPESPIDKGGKVFVGYQPDTKMKIHATPSYYACFEAMTRVAKRYMKKYLETQGEREINSSATVKKISNSDTAFPRNNPSGDVNKNKKIICYRCGDSGHVAFHCKKFRCKNCDSESHRTHECKNEKLPGYWKTRWWEKHYGGQGNGKKPRNQSTSPEIRMLQSTITKLGEKFDKKFKAFTKRNKNNEKKKKKTQGKTKNEMSMVVGRIYKMTDEGAMELTLPNNNRLELFNEEEVVREVKNVKETTSKRPHKYLGIVKATDYPTAFCALGEYKQRAICLSNSDDGADFTCIPIETGKELQESGMKLYPVTPAIINQVSTQTKVMGVMYVNMKIKIPGAGFIHVENEQVVVLSCSKALLGRGLLVRMGIDIRQQLKMRASSDKSIVKGSGADTTYGNQTVQRIELQSDQNEEQILSIRRLQLEQSPIMRGDNLRMRSNNVSKREVYEYLGNRKLVGGDADAPTDEYIPSVRLLETKIPRVRQMDVEETALTKEQVKEVQKRIDNDILEPFEKVVTEVEGVNEYRDKIVERAIHTVDKRENSIRHVAVNEEPAKIPPYKPKLREGAVPVKCNPPRYTPKERLAAKLMVDKHVRTGHWTVAYFATWASPLMMVPKPGSDPPFRPTVNSKNVNCMIQPLQWPFPDLKMQFGYIKRNRSWLFGIADVKGGFFQILIDEEYRHIFSVMTDSVVLEPSRLIQGAVDSAKYFQAQLAAILGDAIPEKFIQWLDDFVNHANSWEQLLDNWEEFLDKCEEFNIKLAVDKIILAALQVNFCGHLLDGEGYVFEPSQYETLLRLNVPSDAKELQQFVSCTNWMRDGIPDYASRIKPLHDLLESVYKKKGNRTRYGLKGYTLSRIGWNDSHQKSFDDVLESLRNRIKLFIPSENDTICVFTDASESGWGGVVTAVPNFNEQLSTIEQIDKQKHYPVGFVSGTFKDSASRWHIQCKESFALKETMTKFQHITRCFKVKLYTDSKNVSHIYQPMRAWPNSELNKPTDMRLQRWGEILDCFEYDLKHIPGDIMEQYCWADIISRWANPDAKTYTVANTGIAVGRKRGRPKGSKNKAKRKRPSKKQKVLAKKKMIETRRAVKLDSFHNHGYSTTLDAFTWPTLDDIRASQDKYMKPDSEIKLNERMGVYTVSNGKYKDRIWIPMGDKTLRVSMCILAHCSLSGHRGVDQTMSNLSSYYWETMREDITVFVHTCLQCNQMKGGAVIPRPYGRTFMGKYPNEVIAFDYLYMGKTSSESPHNYEYLLVIKDTYSRFVTLTPCKKANANEAVTAISRWIGLFGKPKCFMSDRGTHFKNEVIAELAKAMGIERHHFTHAYCPWANGSVERVNDVIITIGATMLAEQGMPFWHWPYYINGIMDVINSYRSKLLEGLCPRQVMMGQPPSKAADIILVRTPLDKVGTVIPVKSKVYKAQYEELRQALFEFYDIVDVAQLKIQERNQRARKKKLVHMPFSRFEVGCYVLHATLLNKRMNKLQVRWTGPYKVTKVISDQIYEIEHMISGKRKEAHATRVKMYGHKDMEVTQELIDGINFQDSLICQVESILEHRYNKEATIYELLIKWKGFEDEDNSWEPFLNIFVDVPALVREYVEQLEDSRERDHLIVACNQEG